MKPHFQKVKNYLIELGYAIQSESEEDEIFVITQESEGINSLVISCTETLLIMEQALVVLPKPSLTVYQSILKKNRDIIHGAFALDESGTKIIFRDTLQVENLDRNELEASIQSLSLLLSEYSENLIEFSN